MDSDLIVFNLELFSKVLEGVHQCSQGEKAKLGKIRLNENTLGIFFDCCDLKMSIPKLKPGSCESSLCPEISNIGDEKVSKLEYEEIIFVDMIDSVKQNSFESVFINVEDERPLSRDQTSIHTCKAIKSVGEVDPLLVDQCLITADPPPPPSLQTSLSKNIFKISSKSFFPKVVDWSCESIENNGAEIPIVNQKKKMKYPQRLVCEFCGLQFSGKDRVYNFFYHRNQDHTREVRYTCPICKKTYWGERQLSAHIVSHTGKEYVCEVCGLAFHRKNDLQRHALTHADKTFTCTFCPKRFRRNDTLKIHERIHTGKNLHICQNCHVGFPQKHQLNLHKKKCKKTDIEIKDKIDYT